MHSENFHPLPSEILTQWSRKSLHTTSSRKPSLGPGTANGWAFSSRCNSACLGTSHVQNPTPATLAACCSSDWEHSPTSQPLQFLVPLLQCPSQMCTLLASSLPPDSTHIIQKGLSDHTINSTPPAPTLDSPYMTVFFLHSTYHLTYSSLNYCLSCVLLLAPTRN